MSERTARQSQHAARPKAGNANANAVHADTHWRQRVALESQTASQWDTQWGYLAAEPGTTSASQSRRTFDSDELVAGISTSTPYDHLNETDAKLRYTHRFIERFKSDRRANRSKLPLAAYTSRPQNTATAVGSVPTSSEIDQHVPPPGTLSFAASQNAFPSSASTSGSTASQSSTRAFVPSYRIMPWKTAQPIGDQEQLHALSVTQSTYGILPPRRKTAAESGESKSMDQLPPLSSTKQWETISATTMCPPDKSKQLDAGLAYAMQAKCVQTTGGSMRLPGASPIVKYRFPISTAQEIGWNVNQPLERFGTKLSTKPTIPVPSKVFW